MYSDDFCQQIAQVISSNMSLSKAINEMNPDPQNSKEGEAYLKLRIAYNRFIDQLKNVCQED